MLRCLCPNCDKDSAVLYAWKTWRDGTGTPHKGWVAQKMWPTRKPRAPLYVPEGIDKLYTEAAGALVHGLPRACILMTRTALSAILEEEGNARGPLAAQIEASRERLGGGLFEAAETIRGVGNSGAHDFNVEDDWTLQDAKHVFDFLHEVADWFYARPKRLEALSEKAEAARDS